MIGEAPVDTGANVRDHQFWRQRTTTLFDFQIVDLDADSYLCMMPVKALVKAEKENKDRYLHNCMYRKHHLTPLVFSANVIPGKEAWDNTWKMASYLRFKLKREYFEACNFLRTRMSLSVMKSNTLLLWGPPKIGTNT